MRSSSAVAIAQPLLCVGDNQRTESHQKTNKATLIFGASYELHIPGFLFCVFERQFLPDVTTSSEIEVRSDRGLEGFDSRPRQLY